MSACFFVRLSAVPLETCWPPGAASRGGPCSILFPPTDGDAGTLNPHQVRNPTAPWTIRTVLETGCWEAPALQTSEAQGSDGEPCPRLCQGSKPLDIAARLLGHSQYLDARLQFSDVYGASPIFATICATPARRKRLNRRAGRPAWRPCPPASPRRGSCGPRRACSAWSENRFDCSYCDRPRCSAGGSPRGPGRAPRASADRAPGARPPRRRSTARRGAPGPGRAAAPGTRRQARAPARVSASAGGLAAAGRRGGGGAGARGAGAAGTSGTAGAASSGCSTGASTRGGGAVIASGGPSATVCAPALAHAASCAPAATRARPASEPCRSRHR